MFIEIWVPTVILRKPIFNKAIIIIIGIIIIIALRPPSRAN